MPDLSDMYYEPLGRRYFFGRGTGVGLGLGADFVPGDGEAGLGVGFGLAGGVFAMI